MSNTAEAISHSPSTAKMNRRRNHVAMTNATAPSSERVAHAHSNVTLTVIITARPASAVATETRADHAP
jgi:hypothetical protein